MLNGRRAVDSLCFSITASGGSGLASSEEKIVEEGPAEATGVE
jgi:hypothetical protein